MPRMERRRFIELLGLGVAGVAFNSAIKSVIWELPKDLVITDGPVTHEWIAAEALKLLCENFTWPGRGGFIGATIPVGDLQQLGVNLRTDLDKSIQSRNEFRQTYLEPAMQQLASVLTERKPKIFMPLDVPQQVDTAHLITHRASGLNLRYIRAYDIGSAGYEDDSGNWVDAYQPPGVITRFDVQFAA